MTGAAQRKRLAQMMCHTLRSFVFFLVLLIFIVFLYLPNRSHTQKKYIVCLRQCDHMPGVWSSTQYLYMREIIMHSRGGGVLVSFGKCANELMVATDFFLY